VRVRSAPCLASETTFSRAFGEFAASELMQRVHAHMIQNTLADQLIGHISRDSTAIEARTRQSDVPLDAGGGGAMRRSLHEIVDMKPKRNTSDLIHFKPSSQRLARTYCGPNQGKSMR
jgi:hypothetical protein